MIACVVFDLLGTLVDPILIRKQYGAHLGVVMAEQFGGQAQAWTEAYASVAEDWDSYYTDLDLNGDNGTEHLWEGMYRTSRALFRLTGVPEPPSSALTLLAQSLQEQVSGRFSASYPGAVEVCRHLYERGVVLGAAGLIPTGYARGLLKGAGAASLFAGPIVGPDTTDRYERSAVFYAGLPSAAALQPVQILIVSPDMAAVEAARTLNLQAVQVPAGELQLLYTLVS